MKQQMYGRELICLVMLIQYGSLNELNVGQPSTEHGIIRPYKKTWSLVTLEVRSHAMFLSLIFLNAPCL